MGTACHAAELPPPVPSRQQGHHAQCHHTARNHHTVPSPTGYHAISHNRTHHTVPSRNQGHHTTSTLLEPVRYHHANRPVVTGISGDAMVPSRHGTCTITCRPPPRVLHHMLGPPQVPSRNGHLYITLWGHHTVPSHTQACTIATGPTSCHHITEHHTVPSPAEPTMHHHAGPPYGTICWGHLQACTSRQQVPCHHNRATMQYHPHNQGRHAVPSRQQGHRHSIHAARPPYGTILLGPPYHHASKHHGTIITRHHAGAPSPAPETTMPSRYEPPCHHQRRPAVHHPAEPPYRYRSRHWRHHAITITGACIPVPSPQQAAMPVHHTNRIHTVPSHCRPPCHPGATATVPASHNRTHRCGTITPTDRHDTIIWNRRHAIVTDAMPSQTEPPDAITSGPPSVPS
ncbi:histidine-rich protein PFHRP-II-like [Homarus americanus]|uniref:histidine-rich protein PFHRP-II-like n=1 Tax=Homarus americanus TaxID=6706 RepID=UPI001C437D11|nr:histidine-rich protein PFHRP-II-like [Homarus americanus]